MTDEERLADISRWHSPAVSSHLCRDDPTGGSRICEQAFLLRLLHTERAMVAQLTAPADASDLELADRILMSAKNTIGDPKNDDPTSSLQLLRDDIASAITEARREARESLREQGYCIACGVYHRVGNCDAVENARREGHAAGRVEMREEAAQVSLGYRDEADAGKHPDVRDPSHSLGQGFAANLIAKRIRALPDNPTERPPA